MVGAQHRAGRKQQLYLVGRGQGALPWQCAACVRRRCPELCFTRNTCCIHMRGGGQVCAQAAHAAAASQCKVGRVATIAAVAAARGFHQPTFKGAVCSCNAEGCTAECTMHRLLAHCPRWVGSHRCCSNCSMSATQPTSTGVMYSCITQPTCSCHAVQGGHGRHKCCSSHTPVCHPAHLHRCRVQRQCAMHMLLRHRPRWVGSTQNARMAAASTTRATGAVHSCNAQGVGSQSKGGGVDTEVLQFP